MRIQQHRPPDARWPRKKYTYIIYYMCICNMYTQYPSAHACTPMTRHVVCLRCTNSPSFGHPNCTRACCSAACPLFWPLRCPSTFRASQRGSRQRWACQINEQICMCEQHDTIQWVIWGIVKHNKLRSISWI